MLLVASGIPFGLSRDPVGCMAPPRLRVRRDGQLPHRHRHQSWSFLIKSIQTDCWFESTSRIHPSTSEIYTVRSYLSCLSTLPCKWVSIIESQHASSDCLPHHSMLDHLDLLLSWAQQWEPDPFSILVVLKSIRSSRRQYLLNFQACRHLIAPPLQELCLGIIAKHLCIDCLKGWRATIHDLGTKDQTRSGNLSLMKTFENFTSTSTSAPEHKSSLGGMPVLGNAASQKTAVEFLPDCPILSADEKKGFWPQQPRLVCEELCCFSLPLGLCQIIAKSKSWEKNGDWNLMLKRLSHLILGFMANRSATSHCFFQNSVVRNDEATRLLVNLYLYEWALYCNSTQLGNQQDFIHLTSGKRMKKVAFHRNLI